MNKQSALEQIKQAAFEEELEKLGIKNRLSDEAISSDVFKLKGPSETKIPKGMKVIGGNAFGDYYITPKGKFFTPASKKPVMLLSHETEKVRKTVSSLKDFMSKARKLESKYK